MTIIGPKLLKSAQVPIQIALLAIIIKICSVHISTLLGAQGAETK